MAERIEPWLAWLHERGLAMLAPSPSLPSLVETVAGETARGNWWSHPKANLIDNLFAELREHPEVAALKLVDGEVTLVDRSLFPLLVGIGCDPDLRGLHVNSLDTQARELLARVEQNAIVRLDWLARTWPGGQAALRRARIALEERGLVLGSDNHTDAGAHAAVLQSWTDFARRRHVERSGTTAPVGLDDATAGKRPSPCIRFDRATSQTDSWPEEVINQPKVLGEGGHITRLSGA